MLLSKHVEGEASAALEGEDLALDTEIVLRTLLLTESKLLWSVGISVELSVVDTTYLLSEALLGSSVGVWVGEGYERDQQENQQSSHDDSLIYLLKRLIFENH